MSEKMKPIVTRNFMKNLSRGAVKSVPLGGVLLEQVIYGTLDGEAAKEETEKLHSALSQISEKLQGQDVNFGDIINKLKKTSAFREELAKEIARKLGDLPIFVALCREPSQHVIARHEGPRQSRA